jgi:predicted metal-dependent hydrolase
MTDQSPPPGGPRRRPHAITIRSMDFGFPDGADHEVVPGRPGVSAMMLAFSLSLPHIEPYLIRTMAAARPHITDPDLAEDMRRFNAQEGHHYRMHKRFNDTVRLAGFPGLAAYEAQLAADYHRFSASRPLRFNLAYAEGFEALSMNLILTLLETGGLPAGSPAEDLWGWHFIEELEHRTVTFDAYDHVVGRYPYRLGVGTWAQLHYVSWIVRVARYLRRTAPTGPDRPGGARPAVTTPGPPVPTFLRRALPRVLRIYLPTYTPHAIAFTPQMEALADHYAERARTTR